MSLQLDPKSIALILIDLQNAIVARDLHPHTGKDVVKNCAALADAFRKKSATVIYVHVDLANILSLPVDTPSRDPSAPLPPPSASQLVPDAGFQPDAGDILITKYQWGAFFGTNLEQLLRDRAISTLVIAGIATNFGVESTARAAAGLGFATLLPEDAMSSFSADAHRFATATIFPRIARVRPTHEILSAIQ